MKKSFLLALLLCAYVFNAASAQKKTSTSIGSKIAFKNYIPVEPIEFFGDVSVVTLKEGVQTKPIKELTKKEMLHFLTNESAITSIAEVDEVGNMVYIPSRISKKDKQYIITMSYVKYSTVEVNHEGSIAGEACLGVGFRVVANISSRAADINLGDIFSIGMAVSDRKAYGSIRIEAIGLHDPEITSVIPLPSEISSAAIQSMMQVMSKVKVKVYDKTTVLSPQVVAVRPIKENLALQDLVDATMSFHANKPRKVTFEGEAQK